MSTWTPERVTLLTKLWAEGFSASQVAAQLGGVTRNAVIGAVRRKGLSGRVKSKAAPRVYEPRKRFSRMQTVIALAAEPPRPRDLNEASFEAAVMEVKAAIGAVSIAHGPGAVAFMNLERHHCRWPMDADFCGTKAVDGKPYCGHHSRVAYRRVGENR